MELSHFTDKPLKLIRDVKQPYQNYISPYQKPRGLWVSVDGEDDWPSWRQSESFGLGSLRYAIKLALNANVLHVSRDLDIALFAEKYGIPAKFGDDAIDWTTVSRDYDGVIITPYHWQQRMSISWYYGWDCASGCIWNAKAIQSVKRIAQELVEI